MIEYRPMTEEDIPHVIEIENQCFSQPWSAEAMLRELRENAKMARYMVACADGRVVGYGGYWQIFDEAHITNIAVKPDEKRKGYGKALLSFVLDEMKDVGVSKVTLEVNEKNVAAIRLYESFGFRPAGRRKKYYEGVDDALIYWLNTGE